MAKVPRTSLSEEKIGEVQHERRLDSMTTFCHSPESQRSSDETSETMTDSFRYVAKAHGPARGFNGAPFNAVTSLAGRVGAAPCFRAFRLESTNNTEQ